MIFNTQPRINLQANYYFLTYVHGDLHAYVEKKMGKFFNTRV